MSQLIISEGENMTGSKCLISDDLWGKNGALLNKSNFCCVEGSELRSSQQRRRCRGKTKIQNHQLEDLQQGRNEINREQNAVDAFKRSYIYVINYLASSPSRLFLLHMVMALVCNAIVIAVIVFALNNGASGGASGRAIGVAVLGLAKHFAIINLMTSLVLLVSLIHKWRSLSRWQKPIGVMSVCCLALPCLLAILVFIYVII
ncbi:hypothetical protein DCF83_14925 [Edwardsiella tarda]|uniref:hypothetical protein n=1 Tax=Edwardsiella tarda TaxID=636 RepID=UPI0015E7EA88|nr:hypothetical protein [Edwardsiella tarda]UCQ27285.1 hypothetical protein DCF83_14925 [Edwardsiella tarda]